MNINGLCGERCIRNVTRTADIPRLVKMYKEKNKYLNYLKMIKVSVSHRIQYQV